MVNVQKPLLRLFNLFFLVRPMVTQDCDDSSDSNQCSVGEMCFGTNCETAKPCSGHHDCSGTPIPTWCRLDYCQRSPCGTTGQCVHGHVCSQDSYLMSCVYPVDITIEEGSELRLQFEEPAPPGSYEDIKWYKGSTNGYDRIVHFIEGTIFNYWGDYCSSASPCDASNKSDKGELDTHTGTFTIHQVKLSDSSYYYYAFYSGITGDTGNNYEYIVDVYVEPKQDQLVIDGISDSIVEVGTNVSLTCTINRIKPKAAEMFWTINGRRKNGTLSSSNNVDGTYKQRIAIVHTVSEEDHNQLIKCIVVSVYKTREELHQIVNSRSGGVNVVLIGTVVGVVALLVVIAIVIFVVCKKYNINVTPKKKEESTVSPSEPDAANSLYEELDSMPHSHMNLNPEQQNGGYEHPVTNGDNIQDQYDDVEGTMHKTVGARKESGYDNPGMVTEEYEDIDDAKSQTITDDLAYEDIL